MFNSAQDQLADAALQSSTDLDAVAKKTGLTIKQIDGFSKTSGGGALPNIPKLIEAVFSQDVIASGASRGRPMSRSKSASSVSPLAQPALKSMYCAWATRNGAS